MRTSRISIVGLMLALVAPVWAAPPSPKPAAPGAGPVPASAAAPAAAKAGEHAASAAALHFIADDSNAALAEAKRRRVPIFVEAWAPW